MLGKDTEPVFQFSIYWSHTIILADTPLIEVLKYFRYVSKMVQVSMDEHNVNWFLLDSLVIHQNRKMQMHLI